jgi:hypothetical protein
MKHLLLHGLLLAILAAGSGWAAEPNAGLYVGLRRSSYGQKNTDLVPVAAAEPLVPLRRSSYGQKNTDNAWWAERAKQFAARFPAATPVIIEIVSTYQDNGSPQFEFKRPKDFPGKMEHFRFATEGIDHEAALGEYDRQGVKAILQVESGNADMIECLQLIHHQFGSHACVIGLGMDAEWFNTRESRGKEGRPITDAEAKKWLEATLALNPKYTLFLKHFTIEHMPPTYRHPQLWFLDDSQQFKSADGMMTDFKDWGDHFKDSTTGYQFGYEDDQRWWSKLKSPPLELGTRIRQEIPNDRYLFWVDFTADRVTFSSKP